MYRVRNRRVLPRVKNLSFERGTKEDAVIQRLEAVLA